MTADRLEDIFRRQQALDEAISRAFSLDFDRETWMEKDLLALQAEVAEVLGELNYRWWRPPRPVDETRLREELVDVLHFFVSLCLRAGMTAEDLYRGYLAKNEENWRRLSRARQGGA